MADAYLIDLLRSIYNHNIIDLIIIEFIIIDINQRT